ncbi:hypothetical protein SSYRP_v1c04680 [Spiroplasma syrphidicola EA-1]|uniref:Uncharacterized protein n=1 Tax=Spiroplasma syrphidicola EA-1 TaxID=1276229 RepID=R4UIS3_9MOLU|nr:hypothetical protein [Spiroplasma syrphidicola]AGM26060.1 hypothetical protein SSYRP_v1c04680 [Spiroplasma syrphidicola EA-1]
MLKLFRFDEPINNKIKLLETTKIDWNEIASENFTDLKTVLNDFANELIGYTEVNNKVSYLVFTDNYDQNYLENEDITFRILSNEALINERYEVSDILSGNLLLKELGISNEEVLLNNEPYHFKNDNSYELE